MTAAKPPSRKGETHVVSARLNDRQLLVLGEAIRASGLGRSEFMRRAMLQRTIRFWPFEPLLAEAVAVASLCRRTALACDPEFTDSIARLEALIDRLCTLAEVEVR